MLLLSLWLVAYTTKMQQGCEYDGDNGPAVASENPLEDALKAGMRHHPSLAEVDTTSLRK